MRSILLLILTLSSCFSAAQQFHKIGDATNMKNSCVRLTPDAPYREGIAYSVEKLDLQRRFSIEFDIFLGDKDNGADGITFVIHNDAREFYAYGNWGECMGYGRFNPNYRGTCITPSIAIEFDTYQNPNQNDPSSDHVAYLENGVSRHQQHWNNNDSTFNLEDNRLHSFGLTWNPETEMINVYLDGMEVYRGQKDLINDIFQGKTRVIWGFTASTGRKYNLQYFCLKRLAYITSPPVQSNQGQP